MKKVKCLVVFGTRPEAIKMAPVVKIFKAHSNYFETRVCITAQHREMLDQVIDFFKISIDYDLDLMKSNQDLYSLTSDIVSGLRRPLEDFKPDYVFVHGDTTTSMATGLASFYSGAKVCHIEAGLRTFNKQSPFPEELNRQITGRIADFHFAPTEGAKMNLLKENVQENSIIVTGNTVIDALLESIDRIKSISNTEIKSLEALLINQRKVILVTAHRRENHGQGFINICEALKEIAEKHKDLTIIYPVHLNPKVKEPVNEILSNIDNVKLIAPLSYPTFVWLMDKAYLILTDSGGVQEEAPSLGKPVLVMRNTTERPEALEVGTVILVGTDKDKIIRECNSLLLDNEKYFKMSSLHNPYGDGKAAERIVSFIKSISF